MSPSATTITERLISCPTCKRPVARPVEDGESVKCECGAVLRCVESETPSGWSWKVLAYSFGRGRN
jgi:hypothetical protein